MSPNGFSTPDARSAIQERYNNTWKLLLEIVETGWHAQLLLRQNWQTNFRMVELTSLLYWEDNSHPTCTTKHHYLPHDVHCYSHHHRQPDQLAFQRLPMGIRPGDKEVEDPFGFLEVTNTTQGGWRTRLQGLHRTCGSPHVSMGGQKHGGSTLGVGCLLGNHERVHLGKPQVTK